jgi:hypothetical protein
MAMRFELFTTSPICMMAGSGKPHKMDSGRLNRRVRSSDGDTPVCRQGVHWVLVAKLGVLLPRLRPEKSSTSMQG